MHCVQDGSAQERQAERIHRDACRGIHVPWTWHSEEAGRDCDRQDAEVPLRRDYARDRGGKRRGAKSV